MNVGASRYYEWEPIRQIGQLHRGLTAHRNETRHWLRSAPHMEFIEIDYPTLVRDPRAQISRLVEFLGAERLPNSGEMAKAVDPSLRRKKSVL